MGPVEGLILGVVVVAAVLAVTALGAGVVVAELAGWTSRKAIAKARRRVEAELDELEVRDLRDHQGRLRFEVDGRPGWWQVTELGGEGQLEVRGVPDFVAGQRWLSGGDLLVGRSPFDQEVRIETAQPKALAMLLRPAALGLVRSFDEVRVQAGQLFVRARLGEAGGPGRALHLRELLERAPMEPDAPVRLLDGMVRTCLRVPVDSTLRAARQLEGASPSGNVVVDQLIQVSGPHPLLEDEAFVAQLLELVHGLGGRLTAEAVEVELPGVREDVRTEQALLDAIATRLRSTPERGR